MAMLQRQRQAQRLQQKADPQLLLTNRLLQMPVLELQQSVSQEVEENPALEAGDEELGCGRCQYLALRCPDCPLGPALGRLTAPDRSEFQASLADRAAGEEEPDPFALVEAPQTLQEYLLTQLGASASPEQMPIGRYLVANVDGDGYLRCTVTEAAQVLRVSPEAVEAVVRLLQALDPSGVGARSLQECLLIQARAAEAEGSAPPYLVAILQDHWKDMVGARWSTIARRLRTRIDEVERTVGWLRHNLSPYPGSLYRPAGARSSARARQAVRPDVVVTIEEAGELDVTVPAQEFPALRVNPQYAELWQRMREQPEHYGAAERKHVQEYIHRAQMYLKGLEDRGSMMRRMAECLASEQERYFRTEREEDMLPLTQSQLASFLHVHESTVSRAVADKFLQLPSGRVVPLSQFFDRAMSHRKLVANVVADEDPRSPYSDQEISDILRRQGVQIARRTVMKYREELSILSSRQRALAPR